MVAGAAEARALAEVADSAPFVVQEEVSSKQGIGRVLSRRAWLRANLGGKEEGERMWAAPRWRGLTRGG